MRLTRILLVLSCFVVTPLVAQDSLPPASPLQSAPIKKRGKPLTYFFKSFLLPGWGQSELDRNLTGSLFMAVEGVSLSMGMKAHYEAKYLERAKSGRLKDKKAEREDWFFLMAVNHLLSGMEAYVSASLFDFPADLHVKPLDNGRTGLGFTLPIGKGRP